MRLRTKLVLTATGLTSVIVLVLSILFLGELLHQRLEQTSSNSDAQAHEVWLVTYQAVVTGLSARPAMVGPATEKTPEEALHEAVTDALRSSDALANVMNAIVRYSPPVQDVSVTDAHGMTLVSTDPDALNQLAKFRMSFASVRDGSLAFQMREVFGKPHVLDVSVPLDRNRMPFLVVHLGLRSTLLRNAYEPWLRAALWIALLAALASMAAAALLSAVALRPLRVIGEQLERLTLPRGEISSDQPALLMGENSAVESKADPVGLVNRTIDRLGREMRSREEGYTALQTNMNQMLDTLRDGVLLFTADRRAVMVSDAAANFIQPLGEDSESEPPVSAWIGKQMEEIFPPDTALGSAILSAFESGRQVVAEMVVLEDGRQVQISLDHIEDTRAGGAGNPEPPDAVRDLGTLLTLRDTASALELEQELEVSRRLAAIGRLTANVGHEVKNPINAMVVHLELLRGKLANGAVEPRSAQKHVEILADEMHRLDRVVQTLADFSRPMNLNLREHDLRSVVAQVLELAGAELRQHGVVLETEIPTRPVLARVDAELLRQALLNLVLNAMQAMDAGGILRVSVRREQRLAVIEVADNGTGIPGSVLPRIFDLYFTTKPTGSGIGLAMTYRILQLHGGAMDVRSETDPSSPQRGTVFTLRVPISIAPAGDTRRLVSRPGNGGEGSSFDFASNATAHNRVASNGEIADNMERREIG